MHFKMKVEQCNICQVLTVPVLALIEKAGLRTLQRYYQLAMGLIRYHRNQTFSYCVGALSAHVTKQ